MAAAAPDADARQSGTAQAGSPDAWADAVGDKAPTQEVGRDQCTEFAFVIPECEKGVTLKVLAPDKLVLRIPLPLNVLPGDKMHVIKEEGKWGIKHVVRAVAAAATESQWAGTPPANGNADSNEASPARLQFRTAAELEADLAGSGTIDVQLDTTKGPISLRVVSDWAPHGAARFLQLIDDGFFSDVAFYRAVPNFLVQFGIVKDTTHAGGQYPPIKDDASCGVPIENGSVIFAASGNNSRKVTICIFLNDFPELGHKPWETPIGKLCPESLETLHKIYTGYGDIPQCGGSGPDPLELEARGNEYITTEFPDCDFIRAASRLQLGQLSSGVPSSLPIEGEVLPPNLSENGPQASASELTRAKTAPAEAKRSPRQAASKSSATRPSSTLPKKASTADKLRAGGDAPGQLKKSGQSLTAAPKASSSSRVSVTSRSATTIAMNSSPKKAPKALFGDRPRSPGLERFQPVGRSAASASTQSGERPASSGPRRPGGAASTSRTAMTTSGLGAKPAQQSSSHTVPAGTRQSLGQDSAKGTSQSRREGPRKTQ